MDSLVPTEWLERELGAPDLKILDATTFLPGTGRDARAEFEQQHIPGAVFVDIEEVSDSDSPLPHMMPSEARFASRMQSLGARDGNRFVVYDNSPLHSAARVWWMLKSSAPIMSPCSTAASRSGPPRAGRSSRAASNIATAISPPSSTARRWSTRRRCSAWSAPAATRSSTRGRRSASPAASPSRGRASPRATFPGARSLPQGELFNPDNSWKQGEALRAAFEGAGVDLAKPMVTTCGSGVTAAVLLFGAHLLGKHDVRLYDGSWSEWGADPATPKGTLPQGEVAGPK